MDPQPYQTRQQAIVEDMTIYNAVSIKLELFAALTDCQALELDLGQVGEIDTTGLQLLILAKRESAQQGKNLHLIGHSPAVRTAIDCFGMTGFFGDPVIITIQELAQ